MHRCLVVAHQTLAGAELVGYVDSVRAEHADAQFHVVVPVLRSIGLTEAQARADARQALDQLFERVAAKGADDVTGEIGAADPVDAIEAVVAREGHDAFAEIIVSTLPRGISGWLNGNVPRRVERAYPAIQVTHIVAEESDRQPVGTGSRRPSDHAGPSMAIH